MKWIKSFFIVSFLVVNFTRLLFGAPLTIEINKGQDRPFPVAVLPFSGSSIQSQLTETINTDLKNSGRFDLVPQTKQPQKISSSGGIKWSLWSHLGTEYLIIGDVKEVSKNKYDVRFQVISQLGNQAITGRVFNNVSGAQLDALGHVIANYIYQAITGDRGYFTTKLAYIDVSNPYNLSRARYNLVIADYDGQNPQVLLSQPRNPLASPTWSTDGKELAYVSYVKGRMAVYTINLSTGKRTLVANYPGINSSPAFDPVSNEMVVALSKKENSATTQLYLTQPKMNGIVKQLTYSGTNNSPSFSPDGKEIVFTSTRGGQPQIYSMNIHDRVAKRLTFNGVQNFDPKYTPDGKDIVFMHQEHSGGSIGIAKLNLKTGKMTALTNGPVDKSPSVSPNGSMISYTKTNSEGGLGLGMVSTDGNIQINLPASNSSVNIESPAWSPFLN